MKIGDITLKHNLILAPMAGVSDVGFRATCIACGADYGVCEMVSARALVYDSPNTIKLLTVSPYEKIKVAQIFGNEPDIMARAVNHPALADFDIIDINMGCPAPKIVNCGQGSALLKNMDLAREIITACVNATAKPITVKFRIGYSEGDNVAVAFAKMCEECGAKAITVHGRTRAQGYSGKVDYDTIRAVKDAVKIPVIGNGDVVDEETYKRMLDTGVDAVMIGRGALGCPDIFSRLTHTPAMDIRELVKMHWELDKKYMGDRHLDKEMMKHLLWYAKRTRHKAETRRAIVGAKSANDRYEILLKALGEENEENN